MSEASTSRRWTLVVMMALWVCLLGSAGWEIWCATRVVPRYEAMYEGLGDQLPALTRVCLSGSTHLLVLAALPCAALMSGIGWWFRRGAGMAVLSLSVLICLGWMLTFRYAMKLPMERLVHEFDER